MIFNTRTEEATALFFVGVHGKDTAPLAETVNSSSW